jgi:hypothetical protein
MVFASSGVSGSISEVSTSRDTESAQKRSQPESSEKEEKERLTTNYRRRSVAPVERIEVEPSADRRTLLVLEVGDDRVAGAKEQGKTRGPISFTLR